MKRRLSGVVGRRWPALIPLAIGAVFIVLAATAAAPDIRFRWRAVKTEGRFVGAIAKPGGDHGGPFYRSMVRYRAGDGSIRTFTARGGSTGQPHAEGETTPILYDPANPGDARLDRRADPWIGPAVLGGCGLFLIALGAALFAALGRAPAGADPSPGLRRRRRTPAAAQRPPR